MSSPLKGKHLSETHKKKISEANKGQVPWIKGKKGIHCSPKSEFKKGHTINVGHRHSEEIRKRMSESQKGKAVSDEARKHMSEAHKRRYLNGAAPWNKGKSPSDETRNKMSSSKIGKSLTENQKIKISHALKGRPSPMRGRKQTEEARRKISCANKGKNAGCNNPSYGIKGSDSPRWKGGKKATNARMHARRYKELGFIPLNDYEDKTWEGHHLDNEHVLYIPKELHISIRHSLKNEESMDRINGAVMAWYVNYYGLI